MLCKPPFALNATTRFINPTKTLESMAVEKPAVCTAVHDVAGYLTMRLCQRLHGLFRTQRWAFGIDAALSQAIP